MRRASSPRFLGITLIVVLAFCFFVQPAAATIRSVVVDSKTITLKAKEGGVHEGTVTLMNLTDSKVELEASIEGDQGCVVELDPSFLEAGLRTDVTLRIESGCEVAGGCDVTLTYKENGVATGSDVLKAAPSTGGISWSPLLYSFLCGLGGAVLVFLITWGRMHKDPGQEKGQEKGLLESLWGLLRNRPLKHLSSDWSFKDNWLSSMTLISGALVGLLGTSGALEAIAGSKPPPNTLSLIAIAGALSVFFAVAGPFFLKGLNHKGEERAMLQTPTVGGTLWAALVSLLGTLGLITCVAWQGMVLTSGGVRWGIFSFGVVVYLLVWWYALAQLWRIIRLGSEPKKSSLSAAEAAAILTVATALGIGVNGLPSKTKNMMWQMLGFEPSKPGAAAPGTTPAVPEPEAEVSPAADDAATLMAAEDWVRAHVPRHNALI
ncbi:MAG: hypothetical protein JXA57_03455 [Armatimonadetes bacterium]|nr:hypothetical protein [Armatimonadota bacterium]